MDQIVSYFVHLPIYLTNVGVCNLTGFVTSKEFLKKQNVLRHLQVEYCCLCSFSKNKFETQLKLVLLHVW